MDKTKINKDYKYELSAIISADNFVYAILDYGNKLVASNSIPGLGMDLLAHDTTSFGLGLEREGLLDIQTRKINVGIHSHKFTFAAKDDFDSRHKKTYFQNITPLDVHDYIGVDDLGDFYNLYGMHKSIKNNLRIFFQEPSVFHVSTALTNLALSQKRDGVTVLVGDDIIDMTVIKNGRFVLANQYKVTSENSFLYYIALQFDQFGLDPKSDQVNISNFASDTTPLRSLLRTYFSHVNFIEAPFQLGSDNLSTLQIAYHLYCVSKCA